MVLVPEQKKKLMSWYKDTEAKGYSREQLKTILVAQHYSESDIKSITYKFPIKTFVVAILLLLSLSASVFYIYTGYTFSKEVVNINSDIKTAPYTIAESQHEIFMEQLIQNISGTSPERFDRRPVRIDADGRIVMAPFEHPDFNLTVFHECNLNTYSCNNISNLTWTEFEKFLVIKSKKLIVGNSNSILVGIRLINNTLFVNDRFDANEIPVLLRKYGASVNSEIPAKIRDALKEELAVKFSNILTLEPYEPSTSNYLLLGFKVTHIESEFDLFIEQVSPVIEAYADLGSELYLWRLIESDTKFVSRYNITSIESVAFVSTGVSNNLNIPTNFEDLFPFTDTHKTKLELLYYDSQYFNVYNKLNLLKSQANYTESNIILERTRLFLEFKQKKVCYERDTPYGPVVDKDCILDYAVKLRMPQLCNGDMSCVANYAVKLNQTDICLLYETDSYLRVKCEDMLLKTFNQVGSLN